MANTGVKVERADTHFEQIPVSVVKKLTARHAMTTTKVAANPPKSKRLRVRAIRTN